MRSYVISYVVYHSQNSKLGRMGNEFIGGKTMELEKLKELQNKIQSLASTLDAVTEEYFGTEEHLIRQELEDAWRLLDAALNNIYFEITFQEEHKNPVADPVEPVPVLTDETFRALLRALTPETAKKDLQTAKEVFNWAEKIKNLDADLIPTFATMMLIEYGKLASKKEQPQAADPEGDQCDHP